MTQTPTPPEQPTATADYGFDIIINNGVSYLPSSGDDDSSDTLQGPVPPYWNRVQCDILDEAAELNGFRYSMRYWVSFEREGVTNYTQGQWELVSQTIEAIDPEPPLFMTNNGDELFPMLPGPGTNLNNKGGIKDGTKYDYLSVFDEAELSWLPRASVYHQPFIEQRYLPQVDDTDNRLPDPQFSIDTISAFVPDERLEIIVTYRVKTTFRAPQFSVIPPIYNENDNTWGEPDLDIDESNWVTRNHTFTIRQVCFQDLSDITDKLEKVLEACYFTNGYNHIQLYEIKAPPNYDEDANVIGTVIQPLYEKDEERSETVGFDVFRLTNTIADESSVDDDEKDVAEKDRGDMVEEMTKPLQPLMQYTEREFGKELSDLDSGTHNKEYEEEIKLNEERQDKLLSNLSNQINPDSDWLKSGGAPEYTFESLMEMLIEKRTITSGAPDASGDQDEE